MSVNVTVEKCLGYMQVEGIGLLYSVHDCCAILLLQTYEKEKAQGQAALF